MVKRQLKPKNSFNASVYRGHLSSPPSMTHSFLPVMNNKNGFSLVEMLISMAVFSIVAIAFTTSVMQTRRLSETNIYKTTAFSIAHSYAEQIMATDYDDLLESIGDQNIPIEFHSINPSSGGEVTQKQDLIYLGEKNEKDVVIDLRGEDEENIVNMPMVFRVTANDLNTGANPQQAIEFNITYRYKTPSGATTRWLEDEVSFVKSMVPIF